MARLPINFLLYLTSGALALGSGWTFYDTMARSKTMDPKEIADVSSQHIQKGREQTPDDLRDTYGGTAKPWWEQFGKANFTGEERIEPDQNTVVETAPEPAQTMMPITDILDVVGLQFDSSGTSRCVVRYKQAADVHPPVERSASSMDEAMGAASGTPGYTGPQDTASGQRPNKTGAPNGQRGTPPGMPSYSEQRVFQVLGVGDALWPSYSDITLVRVQEDGMAVIFSRQRAGQEEPLEEKVYSDEFGLPQEVLAQLAEGSASGTGRPGPKPVKTVAKGEWVDVQETQAVRPGQWHISRDDDRFLRDNAQTVFNQDVGLRSYESSSGNVRGVQITRVSSRLERFGIRSGDVLIELNGFKVGTKAEALKVGKKLYKQGVRTFRAKILTGYGRIEERTYQAPDE